MDQNLLLAPLALPHPVQAAMSKVRREPKKPKKKAPETKVFSVDALVEQANVALSNMQFELAEKFYARALSMEPENTLVMDALADVYMQLGEMDNALQLLLNSTNLAPLENPYKWMFLGQLQTGTESVQSYRTGIEILNRLLASDEHKESHSVIRRQIAKAHCSIVEIFMTDLCFEETAESTCETEVNHALQIDPAGLDGLQTLASVRLSQKRNAEAAEVMERVYSRIASIREVVRARTLVEEIQGAEEPEELADNPEMEFCIATAKILLECSKEKPEFPQKAMDLLSDLLNDDDENIEVWYLLGVSAMSSSPPDLEQARFNLERAAEMLAKIREDCANNDEEFPFEEQADLVRQHLALLDQEGGGATATTAAAAGAVPATGAEEDEEWSDCDDEEEGAQMEEGN